MKFLYFSILLSLICGCMPEDKDLKIEGALSSSSLQILKYADQATPKSESILYFTLTVSNPTGLPIESLRIVDDCPNGSTLTGASVDIGEFDNTNNSWNISSLDADETVSMIYGCELSDSLSRKTVPISMPVVNSESNINVEYSSQSQEIFNVIPLLADLVSSLNVTKEYALEGETVSYEIEILNNGPDYSKNVQTTFLCPNSSTYSSSSVPSLSNYNTSTGLWTIDTLEEDDTISLTVKCTVDSGATALAGSIDRPSSNSVDLSYLDDSLTSSTTITSQCATDLTGITSYSYIGDGLTAASAFEIRNAAQFLDIAQNGLDDLDKNFILCSNIDFSSVSEITAIGSSSSSPFSGVIEGNGYSFENYNLDGPLINYAQGASISNLTVSNSSLTCADGECSFLIGNVRGVSDVTSLSNITISASSSFSSAHRFSAPVIGYVNTSTVNLTNVTNNAPITINSYGIRADGAGYTSSIIGYANAVGLNLTNVTNNGNITSDAGYFGGIIGAAILALPSSFDTVTNNGDLECTSTIATLHYMGGIAAILKANNGTGVVSLDNINNNGNLTTGGATPFHYVGGLFGTLGGLNDNDYIEINNSSVGAITIDNQSSVTQNYTAGVIAYFGKDSTNLDKSSISNTTSNATVIGGDYTGGFIGLMGRDTSISGSTSTGDVTGKNYTGGFVGAANLNSSISSSNYTGLNVSGGGVVGGFAGRLSYNTTINSTGSISNSHVVGPLNLTFTGGGGGFTGYLYNSGSITNSSVTLASFNNSYKDSIGGFVGYIYGYNLSGANAVIDNSHVYASSVVMSQEARNYIGGFIGRQESGGATISNNSTNLSILAFGEAGGFLGKSEGNLNDPSTFSTYSNNTSYGNITCSGAPCGGFVGSISQLGRIDSSVVSNPSGFLIGTGTGNRNLGGFVGNIKNDAKITNSSTDLSLDTVSTYSGGFASSLSGESDITDSSVNSDSITGHSVMGGFIARITCSSSTIDSNDECEIKRNYSIINTIAHHTPSDTTSYYSAGFIANLQTYNLDSQIVIEDNFTKVTNLYSNHWGGGFIGYLKVEGNTPSSTDGIYIRRNFVSSGTLSATSSVNPNSWGGFIATMEGGGSAFQGEIVIEDNYTKLTSMDTSLFNPGGHYEGLGGFIGYHETYAPASIQRNYTTVALLDGNESFRYSGGFVGLIDEPSAGYVNSTYQDNFSVNTSVSATSTDADFFIGYLNAGVAPTTSNNFYSSTSTCLKGDESTPCDAANGGTSSAVANFQDDNTNAPLSNWDFTNIWEARSGDYPALRCPASASASFCTAWDNNR